MKRSQVLLSALIIAGSLPAKSPIARMTVGSGDLLQPVNVTDQSVLTRLDIWSGPGNFRLEGNVKVPIVRDGAILWSRGQVSAPRGELPRYEVSFYERLPEERRMYVLRFVFEPERSEGYIYLPGRGEKWYDIDLGSITRGVEGHWFAASPEFTSEIEAVLRTARRTAATPYR